MSLEEKVSIITGGAQGIGGATSDLFAEEGAQVIIADINLKMAEQKAQEILGRGYRACAVQLDVSNERQVNEIFARIVQEYGQINILVNNAGITRDNLLKKMSVEDFVKVIMVNLVGPFICTKAAHLYMPRNNGSCIVNVASIVGKYGNVGQANYSAAKGGLITMTYALAKELAFYGIRVNAVAPGFIDTDMTRGMNPQAIEKVINSTPLKRMGKPIDVARAIRYCVTEEYVTGDVIDVNGGLILS